MAGLEPIPKLSQSGFSRLDTGEVMGGASIRVYMCMYIYVYICIYTYEHTKHRQVLVPLARTLAGFASTRPARQSNHWILLNAQSPKIPSAPSIGASIIPNTSLGLPCYKYSIMGPKTLF